MGRPLALALDAIGFGLVVLEQLSIGRMTAQPKDRREMSLKEKLSLPEASEPPWTMLAAALTVVAMFVCLAIIGPSLTLALSGASELTPFQLMLSWTIGMALTILFVLVRQRASEESWRAMRLSRGELALPFALLIGLAMGLAIDLFVSLADGRFLPPPQIWGFQSGGALSLLLAALMLLVAQPIAETLLFQAVLLPRLRWRMGHWPGLLATAAAYTLLHYLIFIQAYDMYNLLWHGVIWPMLLGISFSLLRVFSRSSLVTLVARMGAGLIFLLTALALVSG